MAELFDHQKRNMDELTVTVLGATGSIGTQTMDVIRMHHLRLHGISGYQNIGVLERQIREFRPQLCAVADEIAAAELKVRVRDTDTKVLAGEDGVLSVASSGSPQVVFNSIMGTAGLKPTLAAIEAGKDIALANKETLVTAGEFVMNAARRRGVSVRPVDSEHCAILQCLNGENRCRIKKLILTCSGGPFFGMSFDEIKNKAIDETLAHPTWNMGAKITVDCATLMNKGLELIEAVRLFDVTSDMVDVIIHRESIIHSMVEYIDNAVIAQMSVPDMRLCIQYALTCPDRLPSNLQPLDLKTIGKLSFYAPDEETFSLLPMAREAVKIGGTKTAILNGANEAAVALYIRRKITLGDIFSLVGQVMHEMPVTLHPTLIQIEEADNEARRRVNELASEKEL